MSNADHEFGNQSTELKLSLVEGYLKFFMTALRSQWPNLWYIDAFAGTGSRTVRVEAKDGDLFDAEVFESVEQRRGSARIALEVQPKFDRLIFVEKNPRYCEALRELQRVNPDREIVVIEGDSNAAIRALVTSHNWSVTRAVMFLDPYGMDVEWETLEAIAATKAIDVWYLFSLSGLYRQAAHDREKVDDSKRQALTRMLGTDAWEQELYAPSSQGELFSEGPAKRRSANVKQLEKYMQQKLQTRFAKVLNPLALPLGPGAQMFSLFFAISNPEPKAIGLATKVANHILSVGKSSQVRSL